MSAILNIDADRCKGCELCISACPKQVLGRAEQVNRKGYYPVAALAPENCIACAGCARICPDSVIEVWKA